MTVNEIMTKLVDEMHTAVIASNDKSGRPVTAVIDIMLTENERLYFLTAKGKNFYERLIEQKFVALSTWKGADTMTSVAISIRGKVRKIGNDKLQEIFDRNTYMKEIYPQQESRTALEVFEIYEGEGEYFDLSTRPIFRESFSFPRKESSLHGYVITKQCIKCGKCKEVCPQNCITRDNIHFRIEQQHCLHCGNCMEICPVHAVEKR